MALVHSTLFHTFPPFLSPRIFLSAQKENMDEFHKEGRVPMPTVMPMAFSFFFFFPRERAHYNPEMCKFTNPPHIVCYLEQWTGTSGFWGQASYTWPDDVSSGKEGEKIMPPIYYLMGYKRWWERFYRWEEILTFKPQERCKGKKNPIDIGTA